MPTFSPPHRDPLSFAPADAASPPDCPLSCTVVGDYAEAQRLAPGWSLLLRSSASNELTQSPEWLLTWWRVFGPQAGRQLRLGLIHDRGRLVGLAPLLRRLHWYRGGLPFRRLEFLGSGEPGEQGIYSNHLNVIAEAGAEARVARCLVGALCRGKLGPWDEVVLPMMAADTPMPGLLAAAFRAENVAADLTETAKAPYLRLPKTWEAFLGGFGANGRRNIVRSLRNFDEWSGNTTRLESVRTADDLHQGKQILVRLHHQRWSHHHQGGVFRKSLFNQFHDLAMRQLLERGSLELHWLAARGEPVAAFYGMQWAGKVYAYQVGRRIDLPGSLRPGMVLLTLLVRRAIEAGWHEFDLLADDAPYKRQLTDRARPLVSVRAARGSFVEGIRLAARYSVSRLRTLGRVTAGKERGDGTSRGESDKRRGAGQRSGQS